MKRISISIFALLYLAITSGFMVNIHYCMGEVAAVDYSHAETSACGKCGMTDKAGCCSTEAAFVKISEQQKGNTGFSFKAFSYDALPAATFPTLASRIRDISARQVTNNSPPPDSGPSITILYGVFRI